jgi:hypothetical protein
MVDLEIACRNAIPAAPPIAPEHFAGELAARFGFKAQLRPLRFELPQPSPSPSRETAAAAPRAERRCFVPKISLCSLRMDDRQP